MRKLLAAAIACLLMLALTVTVCAADLGEVQTAGGREYYTDSDGTASALIEGAGVTWLRWGDKWCGLENRGGQYADGAVFRVRKQGDGFVFSVTEEGSAHSVSLGQGILYLEAGLMEQADAAALFPGAALGELTLAPDNTAHTFLSVDFSGESAGGLSPDSVRPDAFSLPAFLPVLIVVVAALLAAVFAALTIRRIRKSHAKIREIKELP